MTTRCVFESTKAQNYRHSFISFSSRGKPGESEQFWKLIIGLYKVFIENVLPCTK